MQHFRKSQKYVCNGLNLNAPVDKLPAGFWPILKNVRALQSGALTTRSGITTVATTVTGQVVHSLRRINSVLNNTFARVAGVGTGLWTGSIGACTLRDTGYSGNPLSMVPFRPNTTPDTWLYIADSVKMRKIRQDGTNYQIGGVPSNSYPQPNYGVPNYKTLDTFNAIGAWANGGTAGAISAVARFNTTIAAILYDSGTSGWACVTPAAASNNFQPGAFIQFNSAEFVKIREVFEPITATTITAIQYDTGTTGLCSIVLNAPSTGLRPNAMVQLAGAEYVRVLSVTLGVDGLPSFRCATVSNRVVGATCTGVTSFRGYTVGAFTATQTLTGNVFNTTVTTGTGYLTLAGALNLSVFGNRPTAPDDYMHISLLTDVPTNIVEGRVMIDIGDGTFTGNYFYKTFRANDLQSNVSGTLTSVTTKQTAIQRQIIDRTGLIQDYAQRDPSAINPYAGNTINSFLGNVPEFQAPDTGTGLGAEYPGTGTSTSDQTVPGNSQWTELIFKLADMTRVGSDKSKSLANVVSIRVQLQTSASTLLGVGSWWLGGTYGPDTGDIGSPFIYAYRYRSTATGAKTNRSSANRSGIFAKRERVTVSVTASTDPQFDKIDLFRFGGGLDQWRKVATLPNTTGTYNDDLDSTEIIASEDLPFDDYQPFPIIDLPRVGVCSTAGTTVVWVSGDKFNTAWTPGSQIIIGNLAYTIYGQPSSPAQLQIVESAGAQTNASFYLPEPVLAGQPLPFMWSFGGQGTGTFLFGVGDANNPGYLHWCKGNTPDVASDKGELEVTPPNEPLIAGCTWDGRAYVWSSERMFAVLTNFGNNGSDFIVQEVPGFKGLIGRWAHDVGPFVYWVSKSGIWAWAGGEPVSMTDDTIGILFPKLGAITPTNTATYLPIDYNHPEAIRLNYCDNSLFFTYLDTGGTYQCLRYAFDTKGWFPHTYTPGAVTFYSEEGIGLNTTLMGSSTGTIYQVSGTDDAGIQIACQVRTPALDYGDARLQKFFTDSVLDADFTGSTGGTAKMFFDNFTVPYTPTPASLLGTGSRGLSVIQLGRQNSKLYRNIALDTVWSGPATLYEFQVGAEIQPYASTSYISQFTDHGFITFGHLREFWIALNSTDLVTVVLQPDQGTPLQFIIPSTGGVYQKFYFVLPAFKFRLLQYQAFCSNSFTLYGQDTIFHVKEWGSAGSYNPHRPWAELLSSGQI